MQMRISSSENSNMEDGFKVDENNFANVVGLSRISLILDNGVTLITG